MTKIFQTAKKETDFKKQERLKALLVRIGEKSKSKLENNLEVLSGALLRDLADQSDFVIDILFQCVVHLTSKTGVYGALVGLFNHQRPDFGASVVERLKRDFKVALEGRDFARVNILIRFACELCNAQVIAEGDLFAFLNGFLDHFSATKLLPKVADFFLLLRRGDFALLRI